ncbi:MAG TPA: diguanylate cyclase [Candidatus Acidoferrales bacterium]|jgi:diguanylate cyclase (GGDEF)-like protein/PAS domain S-box-containing protein|nr:diguanylate cyclase [Candidatus Acidoferrales bacterium]
MPSVSSGHIKQPALAPALNGPASRRRSLRILFVHSEVRNVEQCIEELRKAHFEVGSDVVLTPEQFAEHLDSQVYDVVLAQNPSPHWRKTQALEILRLKNRQIPLIFLTDTMQPESVAELITDGAADCVEMDHLGHLPVVIRRALSENNLREERDQTEKKLRHSEAHYRALVGNLTYGICRCSLEGKLLDVNQALVTMLGYSSREELLAADFASDILCDASKRAKLLGHSAEDDTVGSLEVDLQRKDGAILKIRFSGREVGADGEADGYEVIAEDITKQRKLEDHLRQQAAKDSLTGLANYRSLIELLDTEIRRSERTGREFALLFLDLDGLKQINDHFGHLVGSQALCRLADILCICCRDIDTAARFGGDEFALVLPETGEAAANLVARRIRDSLAQDDRTPKLSVSIGVAIHPRDGKKLDILLSAADASLYSMKAKHTVALAHAPETATAKIRQKGASKARGAQ